MVVVVVVVMVVVVGLLCGVLCVLVSLSSRAVPFCGPWAFPALQAPMAASFLAAL